MDYEVLRINSFPANWYEEKEGKEGRAEDSEKLALASLGRIQLVLRNPLVPVKPLEIDVIQGNHTETIQLKQ